MYWEDVYDIFLGVYVIVEMMFDSVGDWLLYCYVNNYLVGGMEIFFLVMEVISKCLFFISMFV